MDNYLGVTGIQPCVGVVEHQALHLSTLERGWAASSTRLRCLLQLQPSPGSGIQTGHNEDGLSLFHTVWGTSWEDVRGWNGWGLELSERPSLTHLVPRLPSHKDLPLQVARLLTVWWLGSERDTWGEGHPRGIPWWGALKENCSEYQERQHCTKKLTDTF